jgi:hypothetical protein
VRWELGLGITMAMPRHPVADPDRPSRAAAAGLQLQAGAQARPLVRTYSLLGYTPAAFLTINTNDIYRPLLTRVLYCRVVSSFAFSFSLTSVLSGVTTTYGRRRWRASAQRRLLGARRTVLVPS